MHLQSNELNFEGQNIYVGMISCPHDEVNK